MDLLRLLFPGYFDEKLIHSSEIKVVTAELLDSVLGALEDEIRKSLEYNPPSHLPKKDITTAAHSLTVEFLGSLPRIREILQTDMEAAYDGDPAAKSKEEVLVSYPFIEAIAVQRLAHELYLKDVALIPRIMTEWAHMPHGHGPASGRANRVALFRGPLHRHGRRRNRHHRRPREDVSRRHARREIHRRAASNCAARNGIRPSRTA